MYSRDYLLRSDGVDSNIVSLNIMAASQSHTDEKVLHGSSPIQTFSTDYDCEAAAGDAGSNSRECIHEYLPVVTSAYLFTRQNDGESI